MSNPVLRPAYTRQLRKRLRDGASILLQSPPGQGADRLFEDLTAGFPNALRLDAKALHRNFDLLAEVGNPGDHNVICIDRFAYFFEKTADPLFQRDFVPALDDLAAQQTRIIAAIDISRVEAARQALPSFEVLALPPLAYKRIGEELKRRLPNASEVDREKLQNAAFAHPRPYDFLVYLSRQIGREPDYSDERLTELRHDFDRLNGLVTPKPAAPPGFWQKLRRSLGLG